MEMQTHVASPLQYVTTQFNLQSHLYDNVLADLEDFSKQRPNDMTNHVAWIAGHLVSSRCFLVGLLGGQAQEPHPELFENGKGLEADGDYPTLAESMASYEEVTAKLTDALASATPELLSTEAPFPVPTGKTLGDMAAFLAHHEAYHIGQIGILRRVFEKDAMSYS